MRRIGFAAVALFVTLGLGACSDDIEANSNSLSSGGQGDGETKVVANKGDEARISRWDEDEYYMSLHDYSLRSTCMYPTGYPDEQLNEDEKLLHVWAEVRVEKLGAFPLGPEAVKLSTPRVIDADGYALDATGSLSCNQADNGYTSWNTPLRAGEKARIFAAFVVPASSKEFELEGVTYSL